MSGLILRDTVLDRIAFGPPARGRTIGYRIYEDQSGGNGDHSAPPAVPGQTKSFAPMPHLHD